MQNACELLAQEPWCFDPERIAGLTDWQIAHLYVGPAVERARRRQRESLPTSTTDGDPHSGDHRPGESPRPGSPEFRDWVIAQFMAMGMTRRTAEAQYDEQARDFSERAS